MERYLRKGINRLSLGVQSFENDVLQYLGRIHNKNDAFTSFQRAKKAGFSNINMDIMFAIPGQSTENVEGYRSAVHFLKACSHFAV